jgi:hypothetical protein
MKQYMGKSFLLLFIILILFIAPPTSARDVHTGDTIYVGEPNLNILPAIPNGTVFICLWNATTNNWVTGYCLGTSGGSNNPNNNDAVDWIHGGVIPGDWYALNENDYQMYGKNNLSPSTLTKIFTVLPASAVPTSIPTSTSTHTETIITSTTIPTMIGTTQSTISPTLSTNTVITTPTKLYYPANPTSSATQKVFTPITTVTPTQKSPVGIVFSILAICIGILIIKRQS